MTPQRPWFSLGVAAQILMTALLVLGALAGYALLTQLAPFRYMEF